MATVRKVSLSVFFRQLRDIGEALFKPLVALFAVVAADTLTLRFARGCTLREATVEILAWLFGSGTLPKDPLALELLCLCLAGLLGYVLLGLVVWSATLALSNAYSSGG